MGQKAVDALILGFFFAIGWRLVEGVLSLIR